MTDCLFFFGKEAQHNQEEVTFSLAKAFGEPLIALCADGSGLEIEASWRVDIFPFLENRYVRLVLIICVDQSSTNMSGKQQKKTFCSFKMKI